MNLPKLQISLIKLQITKPVANNYLKLAKKSTEITNIYLQVQINIVELQIQSLKDGI